MKFLFSVKVPNADKIFPASYLRLWDHANRTGGLYSFLKTGGVLTQDMEDDVRENGASFLSQCEWH